MMSLPSSPGAGAFPSANSGSLLSGMTLASSTGTAHSGHTGVTGVTAQTGGHASVSAVALAGLTRVHEEESGVPAAAAVVEAWGGTGTVTSVTLLPQPAGTGATAAGVVGSRAYHESSFSGGDGLLSSAAPLPAAHVSAHAHALGSPLKQSPLLDHRSSSSNQTGLTASATSSGYTRTTAGGGGRGIGVGEGDVVVVDATPTPAGSGFYGTGAASPVAPPGSSSSSNAARMALLASMGLGVPPGSVQPSGEDNKEEEEGEGHVLEASAEGSASVPKVSRMLTTGENGGVIPLARTVKRNEVQPRPAAAGAAGAGVGLALVRGGTGPGPGTEGLARERRRGDVDVDGSVSSPPGAVEA